MLNVFKFKGFEPDAQVASAADAALAQIVALSADDSTIVARLEFDGSEYGCSMDIFQRYQSQYVFITAANPMIAIQNAADAMKRKLLSPQDLTQKIYKTLTARKARETYYQ